ncbi:hypothetical protein AVEN_34735-1 [Araneus ventricosus]|uniref:Uncharacterized protein n=1 Tax=Araneus ventricosus TaxID=182803 RepID=A0A4Y2RJI7_ARAVE|nr:hypothetical protein AVEN_34735-1 [Araneus ventricosus]
MIKDFLYGSDLKTFPAYSSVSCRRGGLVGRSRFRNWRVPGSIPNSAEDPSCIKSDVGGQTFSCWSGAKIPTLARPTQEGRKARRGPTGREQSHQHVEDGIY